MLDRIVYGALWLTVMGLIMCSAAAALLVGCRGMFAVFARHYPGGIAMIGSGILLGTTTYFLCRYGDDLMDR